MKQKEIRTKECTTEETSTDEEYFAQGFGGEETAKDES